MQASTPVTTEYHIEMIGEAPDIMWGVYTATGKFFIRTGIARNISCARAQAETAILRLQDAEARS